MDRTPLTRERMFAEKPELKETLDLITRLKPEEGHRISNELDRLMVIYNTMWSIIEQDPAQVIGMSEMPQKILADLVYEVMTSQGPEDMGMEDFGKTAILLGIMIGLSVPKGESDDDSC